MKLKLKRESLEAMLLCQAKNDIRYYLNGIFLGADGTLAATNGHIALISTHDNKIENDVIISVGKVPTKKYNHVIIDTDSKVASFMPNIDHDINDLIGRLAVASCEEIDGRFPDIKRIVPKEIKSCSEIGFSADYLVLAGKLANVITPKYKAVKFALSGNDGAALGIFKLSDGTEFKYIVMPARI